LKLRALAYLFIILVHVGLVNLHVFIYSRFVSCLSTDLIRLMDKWKNSIYIISIDDNKNKTIAMH